MNASKCDSQSSSPYQIYWGLNFSVRVSSPPIPFQNLGHVVELVESVTSKQKGTIGLNEKPAITSLQRELHFGHENHDSRIHRIINMVTM